MIHVMDRLICRYGLTLNGAAGVVGNLVAESGVLPSKVQGSRSPTHPMRAPDFCGTVRDFTPLEIMNRRRCRQGEDCRNCTGPRLAGVGIAQWTQTSRRRGLFQHRYRGVVPGARILFDMDAQIDYIDWELGHRPGFRRVLRVLTRPGKSLRETTWSVFRDYERPRVVVQNPHGPEARRAFRRRLQHAARARGAYCRLHPCGCGRSADVRDERLVLYSDRGEAWPVTPGWGY